MVWWVAYAELALLLSVAILLLRRNLPALLVSVVLLLLFFQPRLAWSDSAVIGDFGAVDSAAVWLSERLLGSRPLDFRASQALWISDSPPDEQLFRSDGVHIYPSGSRCDVPAYAETDVSGPAEVSFRACSREGGDGSSFYVAYNGTFLSDVVYLPPAECSSFSVKGSLSDGRLSFVPVKEGACEREDIILKGLRSGKGSGRQLGLSDIRGIDFSDSRFIGRVASASETCPYYWIGGAVQLEVCNCSETPRLTLRVFPRDEEGSRALVVPVCSGKAGSGSAGLLLRMGEWSATGTVPPLSCGVFYASIPDGIPAGGGTLELERLPIDAAKGCFEETLSVFGVQFVDREPLLSEEPIYFRRS